ncbi:MAG: GGDEF domain-containing protein [Actinomycetota bacterium]
MTVALGMLAGAYMVWSFLPIGSENARTVISDAAVPSVMLIGAALALRAGAHRGLDPRTRRAWGRIAVAYLCWWSGEVLWFYFEVVRGSEPFPSLADAGYLAFYPLLLWGLLSFRSAPRAPAERTRLILDAATVVLGGTMIVWYLVIGPTVRSGEKPLTAALLTAYPVGDLLLLFGVSLVLLRNPGSASAAALRTLVAGTALFVVADVVYARLNLTGAYQGGGVPDAAWMGAQFLLVLGAQRQHRLAPRQPDDEPSVRRPGSVSLLPYLGLAVGYMVLAFVGARQASYPLGGLLFGGVALTAVVVVRQITAVRENERLLREVRNLAVTDSLTGLQNRRSCFQDAEREFVRATRRPAALMMLDIDHFKAVNDRLGHQAGDEVLVEVGRRASAQIRTQVDILGRYGGEEFALLLPETGPAGAGVVAERIRRSVIDRPFYQRGVPISLSVSIGVAAFPADGETLEELLRSADRAVYAAKAGGRNRVATADATDRARV